LSRVFAKKITQIKILIFVQYSILIFYLSCAIIIIVRGEKAVSHRPKKNSKKFEKPLDKSLKMWYNKGVKRKENRTVDTEKKIKKISKTS
jgi:hypothetical protein